MASPLDPRLKQHAAVLHSRDPRILAELLGAVADDVGLVSMLRLLERFNSGPSSGIAEVIQLFGGPFPGRTIRAVPDDFGEGDPS